MIVANAAWLQRYAAAHGVAGAPLQELLGHPVIVECYWNLVQQRQQHLASFEQVKKILLLEQEFSQEAGELTPTLKAKRRIIAERYAERLQSLYDTPSP